MSNSRCSSGIASNLFISWGVDWTYAITSVPGWEEDDTQPNHWVYKIGFIPIDSQLRSNLGTELSGLSSRDHWKKLSLADEGEDQEEISVEHSWRLSS